MDKVLFTKDDIDNLLLQLAKEYKKIKGNLASVLEAAKREKKTN